MPASSAIPAGVTTPAYVYDVKMTCGGCSGAIERVLNKNIQTPNQFSVSLDTQKVVIWGPALPSFEEITQKIAKTGKEIRTRDEVLEQSQLAALA